MTLNLTQLIRFWNTSPPYRVSFLEYTPLIPGKTYIFWIKTKLISQVVNKIIKNLNISQTPVHSDQDKKTPPTKPGVFFFSKLMRYVFAAYKPFLMTLLRDWVVLQVNPSYHTERDLRTGPSTGKQKKEHELGCTTFLNNDDNIIFIIL